MYAVKEDTCFIQYNETMGYVAGRVISSGEKSLLFPYHKKRKRERERGREARQRVTWRVEKKKRNVRIEG